MGSYLREFVRELLRCQKISSNKEEVLLTVSTYSMSNYGELTINFH